MSEKSSFAVDTLGQLLALKVTAANEKDRAQVEAPAQAVQHLTGDHMELGSADQGYTGETPAAAATEHGIKLEVVKHAKAKRGLVPLLRLWRGALLCLGSSLPTPGP